MSSVNWKYEYEDSPKKASRFTLKSISRSFSWDLFWMIMVLLLVVGIYLYGYNAIEYVSTHNVLKGQW